MLLLKFEQLPPSGISKGLKDFFSPLERMISFFLPLPLPSAILFLCFMLSVLFCLLNVLTIVNSPEFLGVGLHKHLINYYLYYYYYIVMIITKNVCYCFFQVVFSNFHLAYSCRMKFRESLIQELIKFSHVVFLKIIHSNLDASTIGLKGVKNINNTFWVRSLCNRCFQSSTSISVVITKHVKLN